jgi:dimethylargininase
MDPPARLDGGDVFRVGETVFVGLSGRTDRRGVEVLRGFAAPLRVVPVPVEGVLHLRSVVNPLDDRTLIVEEGYLDASVFEGLRIVLSSPNESHGANVVRLPNGTVLMGAGRPRSAAAVKDAGFEVRTVDVSEFGRADGGVTCLSIRLRDR